MRAPDQPFWLGVWQFFLAGAATAGELEAGRMQHQAGGGSGGGGAVAGEMLGRERLLDGAREALVEEERSLLPDALALLEDVCPQVRTARSSTPLLHHNLLRCCSSAAGDAGVRVLPGSAKMPPLISLRLPFPLAAPCWRGACLHEVPEGACPGCG